jgi:hypothetical protein
MRTAIVSALACLGLLIGEAFAAPPALVNEAALFHLPSDPGGSVLLADQYTIVVSFPTDASLIYFDTAANKELKKVEVDFKPGAMAVRGDTLYVAATGTSMVYALDAATGKEKKSFKLSDGSIAKLACHPKTGPIFASTDDYYVHSIDPDSGKSKKTIARGYHLAVDPVDGKRLYTGTQPPVDDDLVLKIGPEGEIRFYFDTWGRRSVMLAYAIAENGLKLVAIQDNAASNGYSMHLSPDGKSIMMPGGGGWRSKNGREGGYHTAVFDTENLKSVVGEAPHAVSLAFHPVLNLAAANAKGREVKLFNAKSMKPRQTITISKGAADSPLILHFGAFGSKVVLFNGMNPKNPVEGLHFIPLDLQADEWAALSKAYAVKKPAARTGPQTIDPSKRGPTAEVVVPKRTTPGGTTQVKPPAAAKTPPALIKVLEKTTPWNIALSEEKVYAHSDREYFFAKMPKDLIGGAILQRDQGKANSWIEDDSIEVLKDCTMYAAIRYSYNGHTQILTDHFKLMKVDGWKDVDGDIDIPGPGGEKWRWVVMKKPVKAGDTKFSLKGFKWPPTGPAVVYVFK